MSWMRDAMLLGYIPLVIVLFGMLPGRRAMLASMLFAWMFLPESFGYSLPLVPNFNKGSGASICVLIGILMFDARTLLVFRPHWLDLPMVIWCICPLFSAVSNNVGGEVGASVYGGLIMVLDTIVHWGLPYLFGRIYFTRIEHLRELAVALFVAGLVYLPLCLYEIRFSPQLHRLLYGHHPRRRAAAFAETMRFGGFRPTVFMQHGLMLGFFMTATTISALWLWSSGTLRRFWNMPMGFWAIAMVVVTVMCKSAGALLLLMFGAAALYVARAIRSPWPMIALIALAPAYMILRGSHLWTGEQLVSLIENFVHEDRAASLSGRMGNEDLFTERAMERPIFGWSGWNRFQVRDEWGRKLTTPDGMWVITLGQFGLVGLLSLTTLMLLPAVLFVKRFPVQTWAHPVVGPALILVTVLTLFMLDCIPNAMIGPIFIVVSGATFSVLAVPQTAAPQRRAVRVRRRPGAHRAANAGPSSAAHPSPR